MYPVSNDFLEAIKSPSQRHYINGETSQSFNFASYQSFDNSNILEGSLTITNQCCDGGEIILGSVYVGELSATFVGTGLTRGEWVDRYIRLRFSVGTAETVPLGVYRVSEANWTASGIVVKAYDAMTNFDTARGMFDVFGGAYDIALKACTQCSVTLGQTQADFEAMPNGDRPLSLYDKSDVQNWRDVISWLAVTLGGFATIDRTGALVFRQYQSAPVDTVGDTLRYDGASFSDYTTRYTGISYVDLETETTRYQSVTPDNGLTYNIGTNPFMQVGLQETRDAMAMDILTSMQAIQYTPFNASAAGNPAYDLGDVIRFTGGLADDVISCITQYTLTFAKEFAMAGVGKNPALASANSKMDKDIAGLLSQIDSDKIAYYPYVNTVQVTAPMSRQTHLVTINFVTAGAKANADVWIEICLDLSLSLGSTYCVGVIDYLLDAVELDYHPTNTWTIDGKHVLGLHYFFPSLEENHRYNFTALITLTDGSAVMDAGNIRACLKGSGLVGEGAWDGNIDAYDDLEGIWIGNMNIWSKGFSDLASVTLVTPIGIVRQDYVSGLHVGPTFESFTETKNALTDIMVFSPWVNAALVTATGTTVGTSTQGWIGSGSLIQGTAATVVTDEITATSGVIVDGETNAVFYASPDGGITWYGITTGAQWQVDSGMTAVELMSVTPAQWGLMDTMIIKAVLPDGVTLHTLNVYGSDTDIDAVSFYLLSADKGNRTYDTEYVALTTSWQMITDYAYESESGTIDDGYLRELALDLSVFSTIDSVQIEQTAVDFTAPLYQLVQHNYSEGSKTYMAPAAMTVLAVNIEDRHETTNVSINVGIATTGAVIDSITTKRETYSLPDVCGGVALSLISLSAGDTITFTSQNNSNAGQAYAVFPAAGAGEFSNLFFRSPRDNDWQGNVAAYTVSDPAHCIMVCAQFSNSTSNNTASLAVDGQAVPNSAVLTGSYGTVAIGMQDCEAGSVIREQTYNKSSYVGNIYGVWEVS